MMCSPLKKLTNQFKLKVFPIWCLACSKSFQAHAVFILKKLPTCSQSKWCAISKNKSLKAHVAVLFIKSCFNISKLKMLSTLKASSRLCYCYCCKLLQCHISKISNIVLFIFQNRLWTFCQDFQLSLEKFANYNCAVSENISKLSQMSKCNWLCVQSNDICKGSVKLNY